MVTRFSRINEKCQNVNACVNITVSLLISLKHMIKLKNNFDTDMDFIVYSTYARENREDINRTMHFQNFIFDVRWHILVIRKTTKIK